MLKANYWGVTEAERARIEALRPELEAAGLPPEQVEEQLHAQANAYRERWRLGTAEMKEETP